MSEPFIGEIRYVGFTFAPRNWAFCDGGLLSINQYSALFSLLGTNYGGDGRTTFGLPDLRGRVPVKFGQGPGLSPYFQGQGAGVETVTLTQQEMPQHTHGVVAGTADATAKNPTSNFLNGSQASTYGTATGALMNGAMIGVAGGSQPHENRQPYTVLNAIIALQGIFPSRN